MAETYKILGQLAPSNTDEQILYTSPAGTQTLVTNITAVNRTNTAQNFDVSVYNSVPSLNPSTFKAYVALLSSNTGAASSTDGITWTLRTLPASAAWYSATFGNNTFVAVASSSTKAASSTDGITWTLRTLPASASWKSLAFGNGKFVASGFESTTVSYSTDGITWTLATAANTISYVGFCNDRFIGSARSFASGSMSTDGVTWTASTQEYNGNFGAGRLPSYGNGIYVLANNNGSLTSTNGITWTNFTNQMNTFFQSTGLVFGNDKFALYSESSGSIVTSTNGLTWTGQNTPVQYGVASLSYTDGIWIAAPLYTTTGAYSTDAITWTIAAYPSAAGYYYATAGGSFTIPYVSPAVNNLYKTATLQANSSEILEPGIVLGPQNSLVVKGTANTTFSVYGVELS